MPTVDTTLNCNCCRKCCWEVWSVAWDCKNGGYSTPVFVERLCSKCDGSELPNNGGFVLVDNGTDFCIFHGFRESGQFCYPGNGIADCTTHICPGDINANCGLGDIFSGSRPAIDGCTNCVSSSSSSDSSSSSSDSSSSSSSSDETSSSSDSSVAGDSSSSA